VPSNPCTIVDLQLTREVLDWWDTIQHFVFAKHPLSKLNRLHELHLVRQVTITPRYRLTHQSQGIHRSGFAVRANMDLQGVGGVGAGSHEQVTLLQSTSVFIASDNDDEYVCHMKTLPVTRKRFFGTGIGWASRVFQ